MSCRLFLVYIVLAFVCSIASGQIVLKPSIGNSILPNDKDSICQIGTYSSDFDKAGLMVGDTANDFTLYDVGGNPFTLSTILAKGKPVLLISGSYTCIVFRPNVPIIDSVASLFDSSISTYIIYTAEAHPYDDVSPFGSGFEAADQQNAAEHIQYRQARTYGERKSVANDMLARMHIVPTVLIDGPCNQWFDTFGPAPNNAYLIDTRGIIRYKEGWFNSGDNGIFEDVSELLNGDSSRSGIDTGIVTFELSTNDTMYTIPGATITLGGKLVNNTDAPAVVEIYRRNSTKLPTDWQTAMCTNVCYGTAVDSALVRVEPHSTQQVIVYFYVGELPGTGRVHMRFTNINVPSDTIKVRLVCIVNPTSGVEPDLTPASVQALCVPNPVSNLWRILTDINYSTMRLYDLLGRVVDERPAAAQYTCANLAAGSYRVELLSQTGTVVAETTLLKQ